MRRGLQARLKSGLRAEPCHEVVYAALQRAVAQPELPADRLVGLK
jgi:hypothetical protein